MGGVPLGGQGGPLGHPEPVLLVGHHQAQPCELHPLGEEGVGADDQVDLPGGQGLPDFFLGRRGEGAGEQPHPHPCRLQQGGQGAEVLLREYLRGGHEGGLVPRPRRQPGGIGGHHRLAGTHVPLDQPVHGPARGHVPGNLLHHPPLGPGEGKGEAGEKFLHGPGRDGAAQHVSPPPLQHGQTGGQVEELLEGQPPPGQLQGLEGLWEVDVPIGEFRLGQFVVQTHPTGQGLGHILGTGAHRLLGEGAEQVVGDPRRQGVDGDDAAGEVLLSHPLEDGIDHGAAAALLLYHAVKNIFLSGPEGPLHIALVEEGDVQGPRLVHHFQLYQLQPLADAGEAGVLRRHG